MFNRILSIVYSCVINKRSQHLKDRTELGLRDRGKRGTRMLGGEYVVFFNTSKNEDYLMG